MTSFGTRLHDAVEARGPLCAGIDPHESLLHAWGLDADVAGLEQFALSAAEAVAPRVSVVKPQSAFYERFGSRGVAVLERVIVTCRDAGALVLLDVKRGDIGSTTQAYADAYLDPASPIAADAITASPYLGVGSLDPLFETARKHGTGVFVLALTSNAEGPEVQEAISPSGRPVSDVVLDRLRDLNVDARRHDLAFGGPILAPGYGAQGGTDDDLRRVFGTGIARVLPSTSRELLAHGAGGLAEAADRLNDRLRRLRG
jgi:orotidine-5'-phosphate decarboxylase